MIRTAIFIPARLESCRLPQKHLLKIQERECIAHLIDRVKISRLWNLIAVCVPMTFKNNQLIDIAEREGVMWVQGNEYDILKRYVNAVDYLGLNFVVNVDGDDLFCDPEYIDKVIQRHKDTNCDVVHTEGLPYGVGCFGFKSEVLKKLVRQGKGGDTNWGKLFTENPEFKREVIQAEPKHNYPNFRLSLDTYEDFGYLSGIFCELYRYGKVFSLDDIINLLIKRAC
jgi:spore coat polysaccharide biosynthesis protein SpsF